MSNYWKQSLVIGGIYWLISLILYFYGTVATLSADAFLSVLLLLFLIPMKWLSPIKWLDKFMRKHPLIATWLASLGWIPYFIAIVFVLTTIVVFTASLLMEGKQGLILYWSMIIINWVTILRQFAALLIFVGTFVISLVYGKSIMGRLNDKYNVTSATKVVKSETVEVKEVKPVPAVAPKAAKKAPLKKAPAKKAAVKKAPAKKALAKKAPAKKAAVTKKVVKKTPAKAASKTAKKNTAKTAKKTTVKK